MVLRLWKRITAALASIVALITAHPAWAVAPPDSARLVQLRAACDSARRVRVIGTRATYTIQHPRIDSTGVQIERHDEREAMIVLGTPDPNPIRMLAWSEIERVDTEGSATRKGALTGLAIGAGIGLGLLAVTGSDLASPEDNYFVFVATLSALSCGAIGLVIGLANGTATPQYP